ncbi:MAG: MmcQ/YjbR family DNA-binding protein [Flammeovirgaceae bacterium]|jgi:predicted DNA-binding protein (MmcQ/YjbR family)|nr:MmcQ/YjbR family DNA-binding protein [Flammeovirgaceae bacterium]
MDIESFRQYCIQKPGVTEEFPFDETVLVFKVMGKIFALTNIENFISINVKADPEKAIEQREQYEAVQPGYHMNKKHWNTIRIDGTVPDRLLLQWVDDSYQLVVKSLPQKTQKLLIKLN